MTAPSGPPAGEAPSGFATRTAMILQCPAPLSEVLLWTPIL
jgi:hypothetical protein